MTKKTLYTKVAEHSALTEQDCKDVVKCCGAEASRCKVDIDEVLAVAGTLRDADWEVVTICETILDILILIKMQDRAELLLYKIKNL